MSVPPVAADSPAALRRLADAVRVLAMDAVERAASGHPGMPMGFADAAVALFAGHLKFSAAAPDWPDRDRFVLSAGHGSMLLYALLHLCGYADFPLEELKRFRRLGARAAGHPEYGAGAGIETTTGPLGQGLANAVGMAIAERRLAAEFGEELVDHRTYAVVGDGCLMEGISHEAISLAGHLRLSKLIVLFDDNRVSIDGATSLAESGDVPARFRAANWRALAVDGHDIEEVTNALAQARQSDKPTLIACRTVIGFGADKKAATAAAHGAPLGDAEIAAARRNLNWPDAPFVIPAEITAQWRDIGARGEIQREEWQKRLEKHPAAAAFIRRHNGDLPPGWDADLIQWKKTAAAKMATRQASGAAIKSIVARLPELIGGSADLSGSNNTRAGQEAICAADFSGGYIHYGVREHAMAAAMNGLALHGGLIPYGGTFLVFSDYCRPAIRLSALMELRAIYVMTHDSIGLGEDGPTHQPVEHLASLRAIPNLQILRPADAVETAECWQLALSAKHTPTVLALSRQALPLLRQTPAAQNRCAQGGYIIAAPFAAASLFDNADSADKNTRHFLDKRDPSPQTTPQSGGDNGDNNGDDGKNVNGDGKDGDNDDGGETDRIERAAALRDLTIAASGSEVSIAVEAAKILAKDGVRAAVVSVPCLEIYLNQSAEYREQTIPAAVPLLAVEAAAAMPWHQLRPASAPFAIVAMNTFGVSAPAADAYKHFGLTAEEVAARARRLVVK